MEYQQIKTKWVIKIGSALLANDGKGLNKSLIAQWVDQIVGLLSRNIEIIIVSSGAIAEGMQRLKWHTRPNDIHQLQAAAAVGQMGLVQIYEQSFAKHQIHTAQVLLTHDNLTNPQCYDNASSTLRHLLNLGVVPIINENDTVSTEEIRFGDNDILSALVANLVEADKLIIMTDQLGVFDADPRTDQHAKLIERIDVHDPLLRQVAGKISGHLGQGGMYSKIIAAEQAQVSKTMTHIISGKIPDVLTKIADQQTVGTAIYC